MLGLIAIIVLVDLVVLGIYFYSAVGRLDKLIAEQQNTSSRRDNGN